MFKGSENVGPGEHFTLDLQQRRHMNGTTNEDRTLYFETLPANQLELALFLESDRMRSLAITKENLDNQRNAVQEERRLRRRQPAVRRRPSSASSELAYDNLAYKHSVIGSMDDLNAASVDDVAAFFKTYYAPNNAVLSIVGDVDTKKTMALVEKYFESIPSQPQPDAAGSRPSRRTRPSAAARSTIRWRGCRASTSPGWRPPAGRPTTTRSTCCRTCCRAAAARGSTRSIVREKQLATGALGLPRRERGPGLFQVIGTVAPGKTPADVEAAIYEEIEKVKTGPIADWEIEKARNNARREQPPAS